MASLPNNTRIIGTYDYVHDENVRLKLMWILYESESILHLFTCVKGEALWKNICRWVESKLNLKEDLSNAAKISGFFK